LTEEPPRALREVERFIRNHEKLPNAGGAGDTLGRKKSFRTHRPPYTLPGQDWSPPGKRPRNSYMTKSGWTVSGKTWRRKLSKTTRICEATKNKKKSGGVVWEPHRQHSS